MKQFKYRGQTGSINQLIESDDKVIVRTHNDWNPMDWLQLIASRSGIRYVELLDSFPEASVYVVRLHSQINAESKNAYKSNVRNEAHTSIRFIGSVYQTPEGLYQIYTGNIFLKFEDQVSESNARAYLKEEGLKVKRTLDFAKGAYFLEPVEEKGRGIFEYCNGLLQKSNIHLCHPEIVVKRKSIFNDLVRTLPADDPDWAGKMIQLKDAWTFSKGKDVRICIIDDGIDIDHPAFRSYNKIYRSRDMFVDGPDEGNHKYDSEMHGTACASIACSTDQRALGVAPEAQLMVIRTKGLGSVLESEAIRWAADEGADIISCSWGPTDGDIEDPSDDHIIHPIPDHTRLALEYAARKGRKNKGCLIFFAAGNGNELVVNDCYASHPDVMAIGSINQNRETSIYSDRGFPLFCCFPSSDIIVQGRNIIHAYGLIAADRLGMQGYASGDYFDSFGGTSASCPGMAGVAALMLSIQPELTLKEARQLLAKSCHHPSGLHNDQDHEYGYGIINALTLVRNTLNYQPSKRDTMRNSNGKVRALHVGINYVDASVYGDDLRLYGCVNDADYYHSLCSNFDSSKQLLNTEATRNNIFEEIEKLIDQSSSGDTVFITYAGHGSYVRDTSGDEDDNNRYDETLVLYDGILIDDEINNLLSGFKSGVNVIWISDSCHSGSNTRSFITLPRSVSKGYRLANPKTVQEVYNRNKNYYEKQWKKIPKKFRSKRNSLESIDANLLAIAAVGDDQLAGDGDTNGLFTGTLKSLHNNDNNLSYRSLIEAAQAQLDRDQQPEIHLRGKNKDNHKLDQQTFFNPGQAGSSDTSNESSTEPTNTVSISPGIYYGGNILVGGANGRSLKIKKGNRNVRSSSGRNLRVTHGAVSESRITSPSSWDRAYELYHASEKDEEIKYIEPEVISAINGDPQRNEIRSSKYLKTYPNPEARNNPQPIIWHLDKKHSQLQKAFRNATIEEARNGGLSKAPKSVFPKIAHIDTGILPDHDTLPLNYLDELSEGFADPEDKDRIFGFLQAEQQGHGHGTVSLLAGARLNKRQTGTDYKGFIGAFPYAQVASLRISETVVLLSGKKFAKAVMYAVDHVKADVITMSMAGTPSLAMMDAVNYAYENGVVIVAAAGNSWTKGVSALLPKTVMYPARFRRVIGVTGATYDNKPYLVKYNKDWEKRAEGGLYMQTCYGPSDVMDTVMAAYTPNVVWANKPANKGLFVTTGGGTSSATPQVAAAAALWIHKHRSKLNKIPEGQEWRKVEAVRKALFSTAKKKHGKVFGKGILRANKALKIVPDASFLANLKKEHPDTLQNKWLGNLIDMYNGRRSSQSNRQLESMMATEIQQLAMSDPELIGYKDTDQNSLEFKLALMQSPRASEYLKKILSFDSDVTALHNKGKLNRSAPLPYYSSKFKLKKYGGEKRQHLLISTRSIPLKARKKKIKSSDPDNLVGKVQIKIDNKRSLNTNLEVKLPKDDQLSYLIIEEDKQGRKFYSWQHPLIQKRTGRSRSIRSYHDQWTLHLDYNGNRGIGDVIKNVFILAFTAKDVTVSDIKGMLYGKWGKDGFQIKAMDTAIAKEVARQKKTLFLAHGTLSSVESSFKGLLVSPAFKDALKDKGYGEIIIGYNMPTFKTPISKNISDIKRACKRYKLDLGKCSVIGHSRGTLVARGLFDTKSTDMILTAGPHLGTPLAHPDFIPELMDCITNMAAAALGVAAPVIGVIPQVLNYIAKENLKPAGITDMQEGSPFIERISNDGPLTSRQILVGTNFTDAGVFCLFDRAWDELIFDNVCNDGVIPYDSSLSIGVGEPERIREFDAGGVYHIGYYDNKKLLQRLIEFIK